VPEGHTIHRAALDHARALAGQRLTVTSPQGRVDLERLVRRGTTLTRVDAYGKHLFYVFEGGTTLHVHLGLFGRFHRRKSPAPPPRETTRLRMEGARVTMDLVGPTACAIMTRREKAELLARIGPDPIRDDASPDAFYAKVAASRTPIGALLLDQSVIAGVGNVYRAEILHLLAIHPTRPACSLGRETVEAMWALTRGLLRRGVLEKRIVTTQGLDIEPKRKIPRSEALNVYRRRTCRSCGQDVERFVQRARTTYACAHCQA
jgi:formamidopyrimidine-DNA glycosylase